MGDKGETSVNSCGPRHPEWDASPETEVKSCGTRMQPFERSKNPIQVSLFGEKTEAFKSKLAAELVSKTTTHMHTSAPRDPRILSRLQLQLKILELSCPKPKEDWTSPR